MIQLTDATVLVNNEAIAIIPNSLKFTEGQGEQNMRAASVGGGKVEQIYSQDVETRFGKCMFEIPTTPENIDLARSWKVNQNLNVVQVAGSTPEGEITRTFTQAAFINDYEVEVGTEGMIPIEFMANTPI